MVVFLLGGLKVCVECFVEIIVLLNKYCSLLVFICLFIFGDCGICVCFFCKWEMGFFVVKGNN